MKNTGFEIVAEDVQNAFANIGQYLSIELAEECHNKFTQEMLDSVEDAALYGNDIEEQTRNAYDEIIKIVNQNGLLF